MGTLPVALAVARLETAPWVSQVLEAKSGVAGPEDQSELALSILRPADHVPEATLDPLGLVLATRVVNELGQLA